MQQICFAPKHIRSFIKLSSIVFMVGLTGCTTTNLQNLAVEGPMFQPPLHLTKDSTRTVQLHPWATMVTPDSRTGRIGGHTQVNSKGIYQVDTNKTTTPYSFTETPNANTYDFYGTNFSWKLPSALYGLDIDILLERNLAISFGGAHSSINGSPYWQAYGMLSSMARGDQSSFRFDFGIEWQNLAYTANFVRTTSSFNNPNVVEFLQISRNETQQNYFISGTLNSSSSTSFINLFCQAAAVRQTLYNISDATGTLAVLNNETKTHYLYSLTPGASVRLTASTSLLLGVRFVWDSGTETPATTTFQPLVQLDLGL
jgi:hypothetical protein